jgi:hypothetical protein
MTRDEIIVASREYRFPAVFHYHREPLVIARAKNGADTVARNGFELFGFRDTRSLFFGALDDPCAMVCSESRSTLAEMRSASSLLRLPSVAASTTRNSPRVSVPVLSKTIVVRCRASSRPRRSRTSRPDRALRVV